MIETRQDGGCGCEPQHAGPLEDDLPIACTLGAQDVPQRIADWHDVVTAATSRTSTGNSVRLTFPPAADLATRIARLAAAETQCCAFFRMTLTMTSTELALDIAGPPAARPVLDELLAG